MRIVDFSVKNYQFTIIVFMIAIALGLNSFLNMPRGEDPMIYSPTYSVVAIYPGTSPEDLEKLIVKPVEDKVAELNDIKRIRTEINDGIAAIRVEFDYGVNVNEKYNELIREINSLRGTLPSNIRSLEVEKSDPSDVNTYQIALVSKTASFKQLFEQADKLKTSIEKVSAVKKIQIVACPAQQVQVELNLDRMATHQISPEAVMLSIQHEALNIPGGSIDTGDKRFNIKTSGDYATLQEIKNTIVKNAGEKIVFLKDIAHVSMGYEDQKYIGRYNGQRCIFLAISEKENTNIIADNARITPLIEEFKKVLPANIKLKNGFTQADDVTKRLDHFFRDFGIAILLVLFTLTPLGLRASLVVMISIPLSLAIGLFMLDAMGYTINQLTIVGLVVALGLLVDDSIVVIENIERYLRDGFSPYKAAIDATHQIGLAILGCTAILIVSFLPIVLLPGTSGDFIRSLPMAIITTVLASLFVSLTIVPFLASLILKKHEHAEGNVILRKLQSSINTIYKPALNLALASPFATIAFAIVLFAGSILMVPVVGFSLFPKSEKPMFLVDIETPLGTNLQKTDAVATHVEQKLLSEKRVKAVYTNVGKGNPKIYYNVSQEREAANFAQLFVRLEDMEIDELQEIIEAYRRQFESYPGAKIKVREFEQGPSVEAPIAIRVFGDNLDSIRLLATKFAVQIKNTKGTMYTKNVLETYKTDMRMVMNTDKAALFGVQSSQMDEALRMGINGVDIADYKDDNGENYKINLSVEGSEPARLKSLSLLYVNCQSGKTIPLDQLVSMKFESSVPMIKRYNKSRYALITSDVAPGYNTQEVTNQVLSKIKDLKVPTGYSYYAAGELESSQESFAGIGTTLMVTFFCFMAILLLEFGTFKSALIVLSVIPLGIVGAITILFITGNTLSFMACIGIISLAGIEVKNSILLVDYTNTLREEGMELNTAIALAGETRFLPIILTSLTAILGLIPLVMEHSPFYSPLAWVIIGGLISSTILTRLVTPVVYKLMAPSVTLKQSNP